MGKNVRRYGQHFLLQPYQFYQTIHVPAIISAKTSYQINHTTSVEIDNMFL